MKTKISLIFLSFLFLFSGIFFSVAAQGSNVLLVTIDGTIDQATVEIFKESFKKAEIENSEAIILLINTPGGGLTETFEIDDMIHNSSIPVVGFVYPSGSAASSAGTYILMSTHVAAMSDYTIIGSCQPVEIGIDGTKLINDSKRINFLVAWMQTRAEMHSRNKTIAEFFITQNINLNGSKALEYNVIEYKASTIDQLLEQMDGHIVKTAAGNITLETKNIYQISFVPSLKIQFLKVISNPIITSLLFMLGIFAIIFGISSPGFGAEVFGVVAILLSLVGSGFSLPILSIIFIIIGALLLIIEIFVTPGFGVIGIGGIICLLIGSIFLLPSYSTNNWVITMEWINEAMIIIIIVAAMFAIFFAFLLYKVLEIHGEKKAIGVFEGEIAKTVDSISPGKNGYVRFRGELWKATSDTVIEANKKVIIVKKDESLLVVKPLGEN